MPTALDNLIDDTYSLYNQGYAAFVRANNHIYDAANQCLAHNWEGLANAFQLIYADLRDFQLIIYSRQRVWPAPVTFKALDAFQWISDNWPEDEEPAEVNMDAILSAMITADFNQLQTFVGLCDAYRVALWNQPFNAEYYAALARGFMP